MLRLTAFAGLALGLASLAVAARGAAPAPDPFLWLESVHGARATAWVAAENAKTRAALATGPLYARLRSESLAIREATDRLPSPSI